MIRNEMATANNKSLAQVDTVNGAGVGFESLESALSMFVGSTKGKGKFNLTFILSEILQATDSGRFADPSICIIEAHPARFVEMH